MAGYDFTFKIVLIGEASEGKSYFARSFCYNLFNSDTKITIGVDFFVRTLHLQGFNIKFQIWDIGAEERFKFLTPTYCKGASGGIIVYDVKDGNSLSNILENIRLIRREAGEIPIIIIGTKCSDEDQETPGESENSKDVQKIFENLAENLLEEAFPDIIVVPKILQIKRKPYSKKWPEFRINDFLTLRLENNRTNIYVRGRLFSHCKYLLLNLDGNSVGLYDEIESIDEAAEKLDDSLHRGGYHKNQLCPKTEFWGHCSNLQAWYENSYDTRLLHRNLAFPLLETLVNVGDPLAKKVLKEEIAERLESGYPSVVLYLIKQNYLSYLNEEELETIFNNPIFQKNLSKWFADSKFIPKWLSSKIKAKLKALNLWK